MGFQEQGFQQKLLSSAKDTKSIVSMGLDPVRKAMPTPGPFEDATRTFFDAIFEEMIKQKVFPGAFKLNQGFYEMYDVPSQRDFAGSRALATTIETLRANFPNIPIILDYKRGDIGKSSTNYSIVAKNWGVDAITVHGYMGEDSVFPFLQDRSVGVYVLTLTSNPGSKNFQKIVAGDKKVYEHVAAQIAEWAKTYRNIGMVIGATHPEELEGITKDKEQQTIPLLIPGVGDQKGDLDAIVNAITGTGYMTALARINSSSGVIHPWKTADKAPKNYAVEVVKQLDTLNKTINYTG